MLTNLSKLLDKSFIVGFLLPTIIFVVVGCYALGTPEFIKSVLASSKVDTAAAALLAGGVWLLATLLMSFNLFSYKLLEGYFFPLKWYYRGKKKTAARITHLSAESERLRRLIVDLTAVPATPGNQERLTALRAERRPIMASLAQLPLDPNDVLPTAFGNAIRAFERYPNEVYGADGVLLWYRIAPLVPKPLLDTVAEARSAVDFMVSVTVLSAILALTLLERVAEPAIHAVWTALPGNVPWHQVAQAVLVPNALYLAASVAVSALSYRLAVLLVPDWGEAVKACYDVGLPELAQRLGYALPDNGNARRRFWVAVSRTVGFTKNSDGNPFLNPEDWQQISIQPANDAAIQPRNASDAKPGREGGGEDGDEDEDEDEDEEEDGD